MIQFGPSDPTQPPASDLLAGMLLEMHELYGPIDGPGGSSLRTDEMIPPEGVYLVGSLDEVPVAGGAIRRLSEGVVEIKRMFVRPEYRGRGVAAELLAALEQAAVDFGYTVARLDTGPQQPHAQRLYERSGYIAIDDYNGNRHASYWGEKKLEVNEKRR
jgi:GNAT superfamily N-acetyltransferase